VEYGNTSGLVQHHIIRFLSSHFLHRIIYTVLYGFNKFLALLKQVSLVAKTLLLQFFGIFFLLHYFFLPFFPHFIREHSPFSLVRFVHTLYFLHHIIYLFLPCFRKLVQLGLGIFIFGYILQYVLGVYNAVTLGIGGSNSNSRKEQ